MPIASNHIFSGTVSGTTIQAGEDVLTLAVAGDEVLLILKNTDLANDLLHSVTGRAVSGGLEDPIVTSETLAKGDTISMVILDPYAELSIFLQDSVPASHASFRVDYSMR